MMIGRVMGRLDPLTHAPLPCRRWRAKVSIIMEVGRQGPLRYSCDPSPELSTRASAATRAAIVDRGPLVAFHHSWVAEQSEELDPPLLVCEPALAETMLLVAA
jgi:hypothetical protein